MIQKCFWTLVLLVYFLLIDFGHAQLRLDSCQVMARRNYPLIRQFDLIDRTTEFTISNANKAFLPQLSLNFVGGVIDGFPSLDLPASEGSSSDLQLISVVQVNQAIWDGGATKARKEMIAASAELEKTDVEVTLYQIQERVNQIYFGVLLIDAQLEQNRIFRDNLERNQKRVEVAVVNGTAYKSDLDEIKVELLYAEERMTELSFNRGAYGKVLSVMIGEPIDSSTQFERPQDELINYQLQISRPELSLFEYQKSVLEAKSKLDKSSLYPKIGILGFGAFLNPGVDFGASSIDRILVAGLSVSWDIGGLYRNGNNKSITELGYHKIGNQQTTFLFNTQLQLDQTQVELEKYQELIKTSQEAVELKQRIKRAYEVKFDNGVGTMSQLLDKTNEENLARQKLILQEIQYLQKLYAYKHNSGR